MQDIVQRGRGYVGGRSGRGKSNASKYLHIGTPATRASVVVNPHHEDVPQSITVRTVVDIETALLDGYRKIDWRIPKIRKVGLKPVRAMISEWFDWIEARGQRKNEWLAQFFLEAHLYAPINGGYGPVDAFLCEGRKFGVNTIVESQRPQQVTSEALEQSDWMIFFQCKRAGANYLGQKGIPYLEFEDHVRKPFHFVVVDDDLWTPFTPLPNMD